MHRGLVAVAAAVAAVAMIAGTAAGASAAVPPTSIGNTLLTAKTINGVPQIAPLFRSTYHSWNSSTLDLGQGCTATVVKSATHDLVLTAAHCVFGTAVGWQVAPGYRNGSAKNRYWTVTAAYVNPAWQKKQNPQDDFAVLRVAKQTIKGKSKAIQDVVGGLAVGSAPKAGAKVTTVAYTNDDYNVGWSDGQIACSTSVYLTATFPTFDCSGYSSGSAGGPWLSVKSATSFSVVGLIGGLYHGGCVADTSYSPAFGPAVKALIARAAKKGKGDTVVGSYADGCGNDIPIYSGITN
jgi:V8-like Glu-specific endopeptidase